MKRIAINILAYSMMIGFIVASESCGHSGLGNVAIFYAWFISVAGILMCCILEPEKIYDEPPIKVSTWFAAIFIGVLVFYEFIALACFYLFYSLAYWGGWKKYQDGLSSTETQ